MSCPSSRLMRFTSMTVESLDYKKNLLAPVYFHMTEKRLRNLSTVFRSEALKGPRSEWINAKVKGCWRGGTKWKVDESTAAEKRTGSNWAFSFIKITSN
ncbi:hypothetical protein Q1695_014929 [Nippostrongylus brasiliensis]|nr:hypothetical protein Q1695_014929 [Nippostrongylus brasiliensis]